MGRRRASQHSERRAEGSKRSSRVGFGEDQVKRASGVRVGFQPHHHELGPQTPLRPRGLATSRHGTRFPLPNAVGPDRESSARTRGAPCTGLDVRRTRGSLTIKVRRKCVLVRSTRAGIGRAARREAPSRVLPRPHRSARESCRGMRRGGDDGCVLRACCGSQKSIKMLYRLSPCTCRWRAYPRTTRVRARHQCRDACGICL